MKTCEQIASDVLKRRDRYYADRAKKRRAAKKYAASGLLIAAAVCAAIGLGRSGVLKNKQTPALRESEAASDVGAAVSEEPSGALRPADETSGGNQTDAGPTAETVPPGPDATCAQPTAAPRNEPTAKPTDPPTSAVPTEPSPPPILPGEPSTDLTAPPPAEDESPTRAPGPSGSEESDGSEPAVSTVYVLWEGGVYAAKDAVPAPVPQGASVLGEADALVLDGGVIADTRLADLLSGTENESGPPAPVDATPAPCARITLLRLPQSDASLQIGVRADGEEGMFILEYVGTVNELFGTGA